jgi:hypothetical protein
LNEERDFSVSIAQDDRLDYDAGRSIQLEVLLEILAGGRVRFERDDRSGSAGSAVRDDRHESMVSADVKYCIAGLCEHSDGGQDAFLITTLKHHMPSHEIGKSTSRPAHTTVAAVEGVVEAVTSEVERALDEESRNAATNWDGSD